MLWPRRHKEKTLRAWNLTWCPRAFAAKNPLDKINQGMIQQVDLERDELRRLIHQQQLTMVGNLSLKIYGKLSCKSGKRMKKENRVFFKNEAEAIEFDFRPCGHCLRDEYVRWKIRSLAE